MIEHLEHSLGLFSAYSVVQRGHHVFQQHEDAVHQGCRQMQPAARMNRGNNAQGNGGNGKKRANAMGDRIRYFLANRIGTNRLG